MWDKVKYFLVMLGIFSLVAFFYITRKKIQINTLQKLLRKSYELKTKDIQKKIGKTVEKTNDSKKETKEIIDQLNKLDQEKEQIENSIKNLDDQELISSVNDWFASRNS